MKLSGEIGFGHQWAAANPFPIMAMSPSKPITQQYWNANFTYAICSPARSVEIGNHLLIAYMHNFAHESGGNRVFERTTFQDAVNTYASHQAIRGWHLIDEITYEEMEVGSSNVILSLADSASYIRDKTSSRHLVFTTMNHGCQNFEEENRCQFTDTPQNYHKYADMLKDTVRPDVVISCQYPFRCFNKEQPRPAVPGIPRFRAGYIRALLLTREVGITMGRDSGYDFGVPYWNYVQSFSDVGQIPDNSDPYWFPSESEIRMNAFVSLALGYKGLIYFSYQNSYFEHTLVEDGVPTTLYYQAMQLNHEIAHLGRALRCLYSTNAFRIPRLGTGSTETQMGLKETGLADFPMDQGCGVISAGVQGREAGEYGMIGFFKDADGKEDYFMPVNLNFGVGNDAASETRNLILTFDDEITSLLRINRERGDVEVVPVPMVLDSENGVRIARRRLAVSLPGGTGDLFRIRRSRETSFPGLQS